MRGAGLGKARESAAAGMVAEQPERLVGRVSDRAARREWCSRQRQSLRIPGHFVVWVRKETMAWAEWGAERGYFELERMDGLVYLRGLGA